jgi:hypothetical protein
MHRMKIRSHLTIVQYAELIGDVYERMPANERALALHRLRRRCNLAGLTERAPGRLRELRVSTEKLCQAEPEVYERMRRDSRFWEDGCAHPVARVELIAPGLKWCSGCGSVNRGAAWRLPWSQQREEM